MVGFLSKSSCLAVLGVVLFWLAFASAGDLRAEQTRRDLAAGAPLSSAAAGALGYVPRPEAVWSTGEAFDFAAALELSINEDTAGRFAQAEQYSIQALKRAPSNPLYWFRLAAARYGGGDQVGAIEALEASFMWGGVLDDASLARSRLSDLLWTNLSEDMRRAARRELRLMVRDRGLLIDLANAYEVFSPPFRREIIASAEPSDRAFLIRRIRRNAADRDRS